MKRSHFFLLLISFLTCMSGCKKGDLGNGNSSGSGGTSDPGTTNIPASSSNPSNAYVSTWFKIDSSMWTYVGAIDSMEREGTYFDKYLMTTVPSKDTLINFHATLKIPAITQKILNTGSMFFYIKDSTDPNVPIAGWRGNEKNYFGVGVTNVAIRIPYNVNNSPMGLGSIQLNTVWNGISAYNNPRSIDYDPTHPNYSQVAPKTNLFVRCILLESISGKMLGVDFRNYKLAQKALGLND